MTPALFLLLASTVLADWDVPELVARADQIVIGTIGDQRTVSVEGGPFTETTIQIEETLLGDRAQRTLVVSQIGGTINGRRTSIDGDARLVRGRRMLLFTYRHADGRTYLVGMALGAFVVDGDRLAQTIEVDQVSSPPSSRTRSLRELRKLIAVRSRR